MRLGSEIVVFMNGPVGFSSARSCFQLSAQDFDVDFGAGRCGAGLGEADFRLHQFCFQLCEFADAPDKRDPPADRFDCNGSSIPLFIFYAPMMLGFNFWLRSTGQPEWPMKEANLMRAALQRRGSTEKAAERLP